MVQIEEYRYKSEPKNGSLLFYFGQVPHIHESKDCLVVVDLKITLQMRSVEFFDKGGIWLLEINFQNKDDLKRFRRFLPQSSINTEIIILPKGDHHIIQSKLDIWRTTMKQAFVQFITEAKQPEWFRSLLSKRFFYEDEHEQEQIVEIVTSVLEGHRKELLPFLEIKEQEHTLNEVVNQLFEEEVSFSFDSFVRFRLKNFLRHLENLVEISIDEYKMEQEYQMFIQVLRDFLMGRHSLKEELHILIDEEVCFYDEGLKEMTRKEIRSLIDRKLLTAYPIYVDSIAIAPLLSIAPKKIYVYSEDPEQPLIRTLSNIFEERLVVLSAKGLFDKINTV